MAVTSWFGRMCAPLRSAALAKACVAFTGSACALRGINRHPNNAGLRVGSIIRASWVDKRSTVKP